jgi:hypothetical protein
MITVWLGEWLATAPIALIGVVVFLLMVAVSLAAYRLRQHHERRQAADGEAGLEDGQEGYMVSAVLGLLALLTGFTFALAVDRFETRRALVLQEANAIGTAYLRTQLLDEPHRTRISTMLVDYTHNRIALAEADINNSGRKLLERNDRLVTDLWTATVAAFPTIRGIDFSSAYLDSMNSLVDSDAARKAARNARVPPSVFGVLFLYILITAGVLGYVLTGPRGRAAAAFLYVLLTMSQLLIIDIDRPTAGRITESQAPMLHLRDSLAVQPPAVFDRLK